MQVINEFGSSPISLCTYLINLQSKWKPKPHAVDLAGVNSSRHGPDDWPSIIVK